jgi:hypothetical protein
MRVKDFCIKQLGVGKTMLVTFGLGYPTNCAVLTRLPLLITAFARLWGHQTGTVKKTQIPGRY